MQRKIYRMHYSVVLNGQTHSAFAELIFRGPQPFAVLAWNDPDTREEPLVAVPLNPADLMESQEETIDFVYGREL